MNRQEILEFINAVIKEEHGNAVTEEQLLTECGIDSFGYAIFWTTLEAKYGVELAKHVDKNVDYTILTVSNVIDMILENVDENKVV